MPDRFTYDVFLSHNSKDKPRVRKLAEDLRAAGLRGWFDEWVVKPGDDIYLAIERGLEAARVQVLCLSPRRRLLPAPSLPESIDLKIVDPVIWGCR